MSEPGTSSAPIRTAVIGFGTSGRVFHAPFIAANPEFSLDVIVTANPARRQEAGRLHPGTQLLSTVDDLLERAADLDLVVIGSPSGTHVALANAVLDAGLSVVVDKPFAVSEAEGRAVIEKAERLGLLLTVFQNRRWDGDFLTLKKLVQAGALGEVRRFESRFETWKPDQPKVWKAKATAAEGGGALHDLGSHLIDQAIQLFGPIDDVYAEVVTRREGGAADDDVFVSFHHGSGVRSHLWMNYLAAQVGPRFHVLGSAAGYTKWGLDGQEESLKAGMLPDDDDFGVEPELGWGAVGIDGFLKPVPAEPGNYGAFYAGLADAMLRGAAAPVDPRDSLRVVEIIEQIHRATS